MSFFTTTILILSVVYIIYIVLQLRSDYKKSRPLEGQTEEHFVFNSDNASNVNSVKVTMDQDGISLTAEQPVVQPTFGPIDNSQNTSKKQNSKNRTTTQSSNESSTEEPSYKQHTEPTVSQGAYQPPEDKAEKVITKTREQMIRTHTIEYMSVGLFAPDLIEALKGGLLAAEIEYDPDYDESEDKDFDNNSAYLAGFEESIEEETESMDTLKEPSYTGNDPSSPVEDLSINYYEPTHPEANSSFEDYEPSYSVDEQSSYTDHEHSYPEEEEQPYSDNASSYNEDSEPSFATNESPFKESENLSLAETETSFTEQEEIYTAQEEVCYPEYNDEEYFESFDYNPDDDIPPFEEMDFMDPEQDEMYLDNYSNYQQIDSQDYQYSSFDNPGEFSPQDTPDTLEELRPQDALDKPEDLYPQDPHGAQEKSFPLNSPYIQKAPASHDLQNDPVDQYPQNSQDYPVAPINSTNLSTEDNINHPYDKLPQDYSSGLLTVPSKINSLPPVEDSELERYDFSSMDSNLSNSSYHEQYHPSPEMGTTQSIKILPTKEDNFNEVGSASNQKIQFKSHQSTPNTYNHSLSMMK